MDESPSELAELRQWLDAVKSALPTRFEAVESEPQIILNVRLCRAGLLWRIEELGRSTCDSFGKGDLVAALVLARGGFETACALWYLKDLVLKLVDTGYSPAIDEAVRRLLQGRSKDDGGLPAIHVMDLIRAVGKVGPAVYNFLSETAHPNFAGTTGPFLKVGEESKFILLGRDMSVVKYREAIFVSTQCFMQLTRAADALITLKMPEFIKRSEGAPTR